ncbi:hypothetical protein GGX14DRAFT_402474 [Mycena pura]|uniref:Uncharacterized protein n=1 Tax=Mycena pura TaxID=153505 RepID=A0AAD6UYK1_9AGAR|nr:hypothetical protein GGX14DRAFT_402474 [Mycena pura]
MDGTIAKGLQCSMNTQVRGNDTLLRHLMAAKGGEDLQDLPNSGIELNVGEGGSCMLRSRISCTDMTAISESVVKKNRLAWFHETEIKGVPADSAWMALEYGSNARWLSDSHCFSQEVGDPLPGTSTFPIGGMRKDNDRQHIRRVVGKMASIVQSVNHGQNVALQECKLSWREDMLVLKLIATCLGSGLEQSQSLTALQAEVLSVAELCAQSKVDTRLENTVSSVKGCAKIAEWVGHSPRDKRESSTGSSTSKLPIVFGQQVSQLHIARHWPMPGVPTAYSKAFARARSPKYFEMSEPPIEDFLPASVPDAYSKPSPASARCTSVRAAYSQRLVHKYGPMSWQGCRGEGKSTITESKSQQLQILEEMWGKNAAVKVEDP